MPDINQAYVDNPANHAEGDLAQPTWLLSTGTWTLTEDVVCQGAGLVMIPGWITVDGAGYSMTWGNGGSAIIIPPITNRGFENDTIGEESPQGWDVFKTGNATASVVANTRMQGGTQLGMGANCFRVNVAGGESVRMRTNYVFPSTAGWIYDFCMYADRRWVSSDPPTNKHHVLTLRIIRASDGAVIASTDSGTQNRLHQMRVGYTSTGDDVFIEAELSSEWTNLDSTFSVLDDISFGPRSFFGILGGQQWNEEANSNITPKIYNANASGGSQNQRVRDLTMRPGPNHLGWRSHAVNLYKAGANTTNYASVTNCDILAPGPDATCVWGERCNGGLHVDDSRLDMGGETHWVANRQGTMPAIRVSDCYSNPVNIRRNTIVRYPHMGVFLQNSHTIDIDDNKFYGQTRWSDGYAVYQLSGGKSSVPSYYRNNVVDSWSGIEGGDSGRGFMLDALGASLSPVRGLTIENNTVTVTEVANPEHSYNALEATGIRLRKYSGNDGFRDIVIRNNDITAIADLNHVRHSWAIVISLLQHSFDPSVHASIEVSGNHFKAFWIGAGSTETYGAGAMAINNWQGSNPIGVITFDSDTFESNGNAVVFSGGDSDNTGPFPIEQLAIRRGTFVRRTSDGSIPGSSTPLVENACFYFGWSWSSTNTPVFDTWITSDAYVGYPIRQIKGISGLDMPVGGHALGFGVSTEFTVVDVVAAAVEGATVISNDGQSPIEQQTGTTDAVGQLTLSTVEEYSRQTSTGNNFTTFPANPYVIETTAPGLVFTDENETFNESHPGYNPTDLTIHFTIAADGAPITSTPQLISINCGLGVAVATPASSPIVIDATPADLLIETSLGVPDVAGQVPPPPVPYLAIMAT